MSGRVSGPCAVSMTSSTGASPGAWRAFARYLARMSALIIGISLIPRLSSSTCQGHGRPSSRRSRARDGGIGFLPYLAGQGEEFRPVDFVLRMGPAYLLAARPSRPRRVCAGLNYGYPWKIR